MMNFVVSSWHPRSKIGLRYFKLRISGSNGFQVSDGKTAVPYLLAVACVPNDSRVLPSLDHDNPSYRQGLVIVTGRIWRNMPTKLDLTTSLRTRSRISVSAS